MVETVVHAPVPPVDISSAESPDTPASTQELRAWTMTTSPLLSRSTVYQVFFLTANVTPTTTAKSAVCAHILTRSVLGSPIGV